MDISCFPDRLAATVTANTSEVTLITPSASSGSGLEVGISQIVMANTTGGAISVRIHHIVSGSSGSTGDALLYDKSIAANDYLIYAPTYPIRLRGTGKIRVKSSAAGICFIAYGFGGPVA